jgi:drug/metabolite transporter (DMT)-like permease
MAVGCVRGSVVTLCCCVHHLLCSAPCSGSNGMTKFSIALMVLGAIVAAGTDLAFDWIGVMFVLANDVLTSLQGVVMEKKMDAKDLNSWGLMYYNSLVAIPIMLAYMQLTGDEV